MAISTLLFYGFDNIVVDPGTGATATALNQIIPDGLFVPSLDLTFTGSPDQARIDDDEGAFEDFFGGAEIQDPGLNQFLTEDLVINGTTLANTGDALFAAAEADIVNLATGETGRIIYVSLNGGDEGDVIGVMTTIPLNNTDTFQITNATQIAAEPYANIVCFTPGAEIETAEGRLRIEDVAIGDLVQTADHGLQPVRLIVRRELGAETLAAHPGLRPVLIRRDALGPNTPDADMRVSPQHRMRLSGWRAELLFGEAEVLAPAVSLVDDKAILRDHEAETVTYIHLVFDRHEIVTVNNAPSESLFPGGEALKALDPAARAEITRLFPHLADEAPAMARPAIRSFEANAVRAG